MALVTLLKDHLSDPVNIINVNQVAENRGIKVRTVVVDEEGPRGSQLTLQIEGPIRKGHVTFGHDLARCAIVYDLCYPAWTAPER